MGSFLRELFVIASCCIQSTWEPSIKLLRCQDISVPCRHRVFNSQIERRALSRYQREEIKEIKTLNISPSGHRTYNLLRLKSHALK